MMQDKENGGISDRPDDAVDVFHTYFGVAGKIEPSDLYIVAVISILLDDRCYLVKSGLSLLEYPGLKAIDPAYALPVDVVNKIFLTK